MEHTYTQITSIDTDLFKELLRVFGEAFNEVDTYQNAIPSQTYLTSLLEKEHFIVLIAQYENMVIGGLVAYVLDKFEQERKEIYIYDLAVAEPHRRKGVATKLIRLLQIVGKDKGAYVIFVQADKGDDPAIKLYNSLGILEDVYHFDISINS